MAITAFTDIAGCKLALLADGTLWQDSARTTAATVDGDPIGCWDDASGQNNHATQATSGARPTLKLTTAPNGTSPAIRFDGSDDRLTLTTNLTQTTFSGFVVMRVNSLPGSYKGILVAHTFGIYACVTGANNWGVFADTDITSGQVLADDTYVIMSVVATSAASIRLRTNSDNEVVRTNGSSWQTRGSTAVGADPSGAQFLEGDIVAIVLYDSALSQADYEDVENLLYSRFADQGTIVSAQSGPWTDTDTWVGGAVPNGDGDLATISNSHTVTIETADDITVGDSTDAAVLSVRCSDLGGTGKLIVEDGSTLTLLSSVRQGNSTWEIGDATIEYNNADDGTWQIGLLSGQANAGLEITGTDNANRASVSAIGTGNVCFTSGGFLRGGRFRAQYVDFDGITGAGGFGWKTYLSTSGDSSYWLNCSFDGCSQITTDAGVVDGTTFRVEGTLWTNTVSEACIGPAIGGAALTTGTRTIIGNWFDKGLGTGGGGGVWVGVTCTGNFIGDLVHHLNSSSDFAAFEDNLVVVPDTGTMSWYTPGSASVRNYVHIHNASGIINNPHPFGIGTDMRGWIIEPGNTDGTGDIFLAGSVDADIEFNLILPGGAGAQHGGQIVSCGGGAGVNLTIRNNTYPTSVDSDECGGISYGETYAGHADIFAEIKNNIAWSPTGDGYLFIRRGERSVGDGCAAANITHNGIYNCSTDGLGFAGIGDKATAGTFTAMFSTGTPNANGVYTDPEFVDDTATIATWAVARGYTVEAAYGDRVADAWEALKTSPATRVPDLIDWVSSRWKATNTDYETAGDDSGPLGSEGWIAGGSPQNYYIQLQ